MGYVADNSKGLVSSVIRVEVIFKRAAVSFETFGTHRFTTWRKNPEMDRNSVRCFVVLRNRQLLLIDYPITVFCVSEVRAFLFVKDEAVYSPIRVKQNCTYLCLDFFALEVRSNRK
jgi:hypothetical protein